MTRLVAMLIYPGAQGLDVSGPLEAFALARQQALDAAPGSEPLYGLRLVAERPGPVRLASGITLLADRGFDDGCDGVDTLLVCGAMGDMSGIAADAALRRWIAESARRVRRVGSVCSGALLLAAAGVLDDRAATTHWMDVAELQRRHPATRVAPDAIYVRDGSVWSSAGITAGMDMALAMIADDHGRALALQVAKRMVMVAHRSGGQSQFSMQLDALDLPDVFAELAAWMRQNLRQPLDAATLAARVHLGTRQFARRFHAAFGTTPQRYLERLRIEAAKPLLEHSAKDIKRIAFECGFASEEAMRRAFVRCLRVRPGEYRARFGGVPATR
ncbi:GlxA family transcriptional regulator [Chiayiivirga flava]|uniref:Transcriptional regulator GlxA family with amidase domain n=1 Tax=Chiayiivirga flava TaxID=659595 RepID=A0A7W8D6D5_9GAMM|nr:helix-turn-helix domain-containing protein [Chiayiivirga flava]MBB5207108.1 transcriptional regulator GlxA family with amidase domain [Chiayiivirga flava]